jgi:hypothetical protein
MRCVITFAMREPSTGEHGSVSAGCIRTGPPGGSTSDVYRGNEPRGLGGGPMIARFRRLRGEQRKGA